MGLDQYLYKRTKDGEQTMELFHDFEIEKAFIYWRKANAIHNYFVSEIGVGDNNEEGEITPEELVEFYDKLVKARMTRDASIFPPMDGFFFGSTEVDDYYWNELLYTIGKLADEVKIIKSKIADETIDSYNYTYWYYASW